MKEKDGPGSGLPITDSVPKMFGSHRAAPKGALKNEAPTWPGSITRGVGPTSGRTWEPPKVRKGPLPDPAASPIAFRARKKPQRSRPEPEKMP